MNVEYTNTDGVEDFIVTIPSSGIKKALAPLFDGPPIKLTPEQGQQVKRSEWTHIFATYNPEGK